MTPLSRRRFVQFGLGSTLGLGLGLRPSSAMGQGEPGPVVVALMLRGALDGLSVLVPHRDPDYRRARQRTRIGAPGTSGGALSLTGDLGLHPSLAPLLPLYREQRLAFLPGFGSPLESRSHFEAQRLMELGTLAADRGGAGFLNRATANLPATPEGLAAIAAAPRLPLLLRGEAPALALGPLTGNPGPARQRQMRILSSLYPTDGDPVLSVGRQTLAMLTALEPVLATPAQSNAYPRGPLGRSLANIARLVRANVGIPIFYAEAGGWDTHANQGASDGQLARRLAELAASLSAFDEDLGPARRRVVVLCFTEFGRTVRENGSGGTDHGHGSVAIVLGGPVAGGRVVGAMPGLGADALFEGRDLPVTMDYRDVFGELLVGHLGCSATPTPFADFGPSRDRFPGILDAS